MVLQTRLSLMELEDLWASLAFSWITMCTYSDHGWWTGHFSPWQAEIAENNQNKQRSGSEWHRGSTPRSLLTLKQHQYYKYKKTMQLNQASIISIYLTSTLWKVLPLIWNLPAWCSGDVSLWGPGSHSWAGAEKMLLVVKRDNHSHSPHASDLKWLLKCRLAKASICCVANPDLWLLPGPPHWEFKGNNGSMLTIQ